MALLGHFLRCGFGVEVANRDLRRLIAYIGGLDGRGWSCIFANLLKGQLDYILHDQMPHHAPNIVVMNEVIDERFVRFLFCLICTLLAILRIWSCRGLWFIFTVDHRRNFVVRIFRVSASSVARQTALVRGTVIVHGVPVFGPYIM